MYDVGLAMIVLLVVLLVFGMPVAFAMFFVGALGHILVVGVGGAIDNIPIIFYDKLSEYNLSVLPLFILMGYLASEAGFAEGAYFTAQKWMTRLPGGLVQATLIAGAVFGAACGTTIAACSALAKVCIPPMRKAGIDDKLAIGSVAGAGPLSILIPPSVVFPIYGMITETSIGKLLIAGVFPGILQASIMIGMVGIICMVKPKLAPRGPSFSWKEKWNSLMKLWGIGLIFLIVIGGIYTGLVTPTEAGGLGAVGALVVGLVTRRLNRKGIMHSIFETSVVTCTILIIIVCALYFSQFLALSRLPHYISVFLSDMEVPRIVILLMIIGLYFILGCVMDTVSMMLLTLPIFFPTLIDLGYNPIWFGVIIVVMCEVAALTPPFGINLFVLRTALPEVPMRKIMASAVPFIVTYIPTVALLVAFPQISLYLPNMMK